MLTNETFSYDQKAPLNREEVGIEYRNGISVHDISYAGLKGGRIRAYLVVPPGNGPFAGAIFVHPGPGSRSSFLDEAITLAKAKVTCLLIDAPWANGPEFGKRASGRPEDVRDWFIEIAIDLRRAIDLISSRPYVDINRIAFVGHSLGALFGGILSGVDKRIIASVLMAGVGSFTDVALLFPEASWRNMKRSWNRSTPCATLKMPHLLPSSFSLAFKMSFFPGRNSWIIMKREASLSPFDGIMRTIIVSMKWEGPIE